jgi:tetratricopeptide (TPR) repeat protein
VQANSPHSATINSTLAASFEALGDLRRGFQLEAKAREVAERFGLVNELRRFRMARVWEDYWRGRWDAALSGIDAVITESEAGSVHLDDIDCWLVRGQIRLARGDLAGALQDAAAALQFAKQTTEPQLLRPALAFHAWALLAVGRRKEAGAQADELLAMLAERRVLVVEAGWSGELAIVLQALGRGAELVDLVAHLTTPTPWLQAATAVAMGEFEQAADLYVRIGSLPQEAFARLHAAERLLTGGQRTEASVQLQQALAFFREVRARLYFREAEALLATSA